MKPLLLSLDMFIIILSKLLPHEQDFAKGALILESWKPGTIYFVQTRALAYPAEDKWFQKLVDSPGQTWGS